jgi:hypothetical protein
MAVSHSLSREIEKALHEIASDFSILAEHRGDGYTEWFDEKALPLIRSFIEKNALLIEAPTGIYDHTRELSIRLTMPQWRALKVLSLETDASLQELTIEAFNLVLKANGMPQLDQS